MELALQEAPDDSDQQRRLGMLLDETQRLRGITRRLLLLAQADAGQLSVTGKPIRLTGLVQEMMEDYEMQSPGMRFSTTIDDETSAVADRSFLTQILQNLLSNASKYNDDESPWIDVTCESLENEVRIDISNGGAGIPESNQDRLFDRFTRVDSARNREVDGFGLGLNLSREFARAMQGDLDLFSADFASRKLKGRAVSPRLQWSSGLIAGSTRVATSQRGVVFRGVSVKLTRMHSAGSAIGRGNGRSEIGRYRLDSSRLALGDALFWALLRPRRCRPTF